MPLKNHVGFYTAFQDTCQTATSAQVNRVKDAKHCYLLVLPRAAIIGGLSYGQFSKQQYEKEEGGSNVGSSVLHSEITRCRVWQQMWSVLHSFSMSMFWNSPHSHLCLYKMSCSNSKHVVRYVCCHVMARSKPTHCGRNNSSASFCIPLLSTC